MISRTDDPRQLQRRAARNARRALPASLHRQYSRAVMRHVLQLKCIRRGLRIAVFLPFGAEIDTRPLVSALLTRGCEVYLPRITDTRARRMRFVDLRSGPLRRNAMGIDEPLGRRVCAARWLQLILMPLVAFDDQGRRLGNGAGYYDRALAFRLRRQRWAGPRLVGLAFTAQRVGPIEAGAHDVPLDAIVTEQGYREFRP